MRESLTIFAITLIVLLSVLLVGPYLVDWNSQRDWLAAKLSQAVGATVRIDGAVDVKVLPRPLFRATNVSIAGATPLDPAVTAAGLDAELSINSLLQGAVEFVDATVLKPRLTVTTRDDGTLIAGTWDVNNPQKIMFRHLKVRDGALVVRNPSGATRASLAGLDAEGEAETLFGPIRLTGRAQSGTDAFRFRLNTGAYSGRRLRIKLVADDVASLGHADLDGTLALTPAADRTGAALAFTGAVTGSGSLRIADGAAPVPWQVTASDLKADGKGASATTVELRAGADARALVANGAVLVDFGAVPSATMRLKARQLDLDRIAVPPTVAPDTPRPRAGQWITALTRSLEGPGALPLRLSVEWGIDAITSEALTLTDAAGAVTAAPGAPLQGRIALSGPDGLHLGFDGTVERGPGAVFKGRVETTTHNLPGSVEALAPLAPDFADWLRRNVPAQAVDLAGTVDASATGFAARDVSATLDGSTLQGNLAVTRGVGADPPRVFADLKADTLDTGHLPRLTDLSGLVDPLDLAIGISARALKVARDGLSPIETGPLSLHLTKTGAAVTLDRFSLDGIDGASVTGSATLATDRKLAAQGRVKAADAAPVTALIRQIVPGGLADGIVARSASLSPLSFDLSLTGTLDAANNLVPTLATAKGTAAATTLSATLTPEPARIFAQPTVSLFAVLDAPEGAQLLRQLVGGNGRSLPGTLGPSHLELTARGNAGAGYTLHATAEAGDASLGFDGRSDGQTGSGTLKAKGHSAGPLLKALTPIALPVAAAWPWTVETDLGWTAEVLRADKIVGRFDGAPVTGALSRALGTGALSGSLAFDTLSFGSLAATLLGPPSAGPAAPGRWLPATPFGPPPAPLPPGLVQMQVRALDIGNGLSLGRAAFALRLAPGSLSLGSLTGDLLGGKASGALTLRRDGGTASLSGQVELTDAALALPSLSGRLSGSLNLAGSGTSLDGLVSSLAGDGALSLANATIPRFDPQALGVTAKAFDAEGTAIDPDTIRASLGKALDRGPLALGTLTGPVTVAAGTLRTGTVAATPQAATPLIGTATVEGTLDLRALLLALRTTFKAADLPKDWKGEPPEVTVTTRGPLNAPTREIDAGAFVNGLAARAIARDQDRIQLMQDDMRERAFFARRLRAMEQAAADKAAAEKAAAEKAKAANVPTPPARPPAANGGSGTPGTPDPLGKFMEHLPTEPPVRPLNSGPAPDALRSGAPADPVPAEPIDPSAAGRY